MPFEVDKGITVKMLPPIEVPPNGVRLRFEVNDSDGLHQAQLYIPTTAKDPVEGSGFKLHSCRSLSGEVSTLAFITTELPKENAFARLRVMDIRGNFKWWDHYFKFSTTDILRKPANRVGAMDAVSSVPETLRKISGDKQRGFLNKRLANPCVVSVTDADNEPVAGVQVMFRVTVGGGRLSATNPWTDSNGRAETFLTLGRSLINSVEANVSGVSDRVTFSTSSEPQVLVARSQRPPMYWIDASTQTLHRLVDAKVEPIVPSVQNATRLVVDREGGKLYWTEKTSNKTGRIRRANLDGTNVQLVKDLTSVPRSIAIDSANGKLYLTNSWGKVQRLNVDGSRFEPNLITDLENLKDMAVDTAGGKVYWITQTGNRSGDIRRANLDGTNVALVKKLTSVPYSLAVDTKNSKLYLTNSWGKVQRLNVDGSNFQPNLITDLDAPQGVSVDTAGRKIYWTQQNSIRRADLNGENIEDVITSVGAPTGIVLGNRPPAAPAAPALGEHPPEATVLLANYPNPFNPETWIPYALATDTNVKITIYTSTGLVVRALQLGHQSAGYYTGRDRAAYWDGRNAAGEPVASGVYYYQLETDTQSFLRKMVILK